MDSYGPGFARLYDAFWSGFSRAVAEPIARYLEDHVAAAGLPRRLLDVGCGTGQLLTFFADRGWEVVGVDRSPAMVERARANAARHVESGRAEVVVGDAAELVVDGPVAAATCTFDVLNHLPGGDAVASCFAAVRRAVAEGGAFVFDVHTTTGIRQLNNMNMRDTDDHFFVSRVLHDAASDTSVARVTGFSRGEDGRWDRFEQHQVERAYPSERLLAWLAAGGWRRAWPADVHALATPVDDPDHWPRATYVALA